jgi:hypothetical protein
VSSLVAACNAPYIIITAYLFFFGAYETNATSFWKTDNEVTFFFCWDEIYE